MIREEWLSKAVDALRPLIQQHSYELPEVRVSCGWPSKSGLAAKKRRIGECWSAECSEGGYHEIFISPWLRSSIEVLDTLIHECIHAAVGVACQHRGAFAKLARAVGLEGKLTETHAGDELKARLHVIIEDLGEYPHSKLDKSNAPKKQTTRMLKVACTSCGCICRMTQKWLEETGPPICGCGTPMEACDV